MADIELAESADLAEAAPGQLTGRRLLLKLISAGWGSSGYYSESLLQQAARDRIWPSGTHMYLNHPSMTEAVEQPERRVEDLAAVIATDPVYRDGTIWAEADVFTPFLWLAEKKDAIGVSIRASGVAEPGEAEGRQGMIVTALTEGISVDYVTRAGRGGEIVQLLESARQAASATPPEDRELREAATIGTWLESRIHLLFTQLADDMYGDGRLTREERIGLSSAIGDGLAAFTSRVEADFPQIYKRGRWQEPEPAAMSEAAEPAQPAPELEPKTDPGTEPTNQIEEGSMPEITEEQAKQLAESAAVRTELEAANARLAESEKARTDSEAAFTERLTALETRLAESAAENLRLGNDRQARALVAEALKGSDLPELAHARVVESVCRALPTGEDGRLDTARLTEAATAAITSEKAYFAAIAEASGAGTPRGLTSAPTQLTEADLDAQLAEAFQGIGLSESQARTAATGR